MGRIIDAVKPFQPLLPDVKKAREGTVTGADKLLWSGLALLVFLVCRQVPIYGVNLDNTPDPFYWMRVILASERGSLMELGMSPIITSGMILQLAQGTHMIDVDMDKKSDRQLFNSANKVLALIMTVGQALVYVLSGMYGSVSALGPVNATLIVVQLTFAGVVVVLLDQLLSSGYGIGNGISLFIACNVCESILWKAFSPMTQNGPRGTEFQGAFIATVHFMFSRENKLTALKDAFFRPELPNLSNMMATVLVFVVVIYLQSVRVEVGLQGPNGESQIYPIKLFYTSNIPIILQAALISNMYFLSQVLFQRYPTNIFVRLFGTWTDPDRGRSQPIGGMAYYLSPPVDLDDILDNKFRALFYVVFVLVSCGLFSLLWTQVSGTTAGKVAKSLKAQKLALRAHRKKKGDADSSLSRHLNRYIPTAAMFGGMCIGALTVFADFLGALGSGTGILLSVTIIYGIYEELEKDRRAGRLELGF
jgi:protein transport protein SEC61 subunit alpha